MNISEEAVQAAMEAFLLEGVKRKGELGAQPLALLAALEAAAPYLMAQAWDEGVKVAEEGWCLLETPCGVCENCTTPTNPAHAV